MAEDSFGTVPFSAVPVVTVATPKKPAHRFPNRVGANFDRSQPFGDDWLPNFGSVWQSGARSQTLALFRASESATLAPAPPPRSSGHFPAAHIEMPQLARPRDTNTHTEPPAASPPSVASLPPPDTAGPDTPTAEPHTFTSGPDALTTAAAVPDRPSPHPALESHASPSAGPPHADSFPQATRGFLEPTAAPGASIVVSPHTVSPAVCLPQAGSASLDLAARPSPPQDIAIAASVHTLSPRIAPCPTHAANAPSATHSPGTVPLEAVSPHTAVPAAAIQAPSAPSDDLQRRKMALLAMMKRTASRV